MEFKRKMREKDARARRHHRQHSRSRSRSRSRSTSSFESHSFSRSRSRSFSRSPSRSRSHSRSRTPPPLPPRYRRKSPIVVSTGRRSPRDNYKRFSGYHDRAGYKLSRGREYSSGRAYDEHRYNGTRPYAEQVSRADVYHDRPRDSGYDYRDARNAAYTRSYDDRQPSYDDKSRYCRPDQVLRDVQRRSTPPLPGDKKPRDDPRARPDDKERMSSRRRRSRSLTPSVAADQKMKVLSTDDKMDGSDADKLNKKRKKYREEKTVPNAESDIKSVSEAVGKVHEKKHKHKKHKEKVKDSTDTTAKKKKKQRRVKSDEFSDAPTTAAVTTTMATKIEPKEEKPVAKEPEALQPTVVENGPVKIGDGDSVAKLDGVAAKSPPAVTESKPEVVEAAPEEPLEPEYIPELSKWERDDIDDQAEAVSDIQVSKSNPNTALKPALSSEIIQRAEKAILLKAPKPSMISTVPPGDRKTERSKSDQPSKPEPSTRVIAEQDNLKITIVNVERSKEDYDKRASRKRLDRSKFSDKNSPDGSDAKDKHHHRSDRDRYGDNRVKARSRSRDRSRREREPEKSAKASFDSGHKKLSNVTKDASPARSMIHNDESNFVPDYDGTSNSSDDGERKQKSAGGAKVVEKRFKKKYSSDSSSASSGSDQLKRKRRHRASDDDDHKKRKKPKKEKKHKKHKKKKSKHGKSK